MALTRRALLLGGGAALGAYGARALAPDRVSTTGAGLVAPGGGDGLLNDASLLSETPVFRQASFNDTDTALVDALRAELAAARAEGRAVNIGAARHSMGGQAIPRDGHALSLDNAALVVSGDTYRVQAGARWRQVIAALDPLGLSPLVMQSNHDFGVAATFSVNAHGWPAPHGPMGSTVLSLGMVLADGSAIRASRSENAEIFNAAMGGYGLIGLITDLEVQAAPNLLLEPTFAVMQAEDFGTAFPAAMGPDVPMAYGRLNVDRAGFFTEAMLVTYRAAADQGDLPPASGSGALSHIARHIFRAQLGSDWVKRCRWGIETGIGGSYYLPYRLHATQAQFRQGYARAAEFVALKRQLDPGLVLRNALWDRYMADI
jgi:hypothetical protein